MAGRRRRADDAATRVRHLLALDASVLLGRLERRAEVMVGLFSRLRDRTVLLATAHTVWPTVDVASLAALEPHEQLAAVAFYEQVQELRWYLSYTDDMPTQLKVKLRSFIERLQQLQAVMVEALGLPLPRVVVIDGEVVRERGAKVV